MRVCSRVALVVVLLVFSAPFLYADHLIAECPLSLADVNPASTDFDLSPHGVFRNGNTVFALRGNVLSTYTVNDLGNLQIAREDFIGSLGARETEGGVAFGAGFLYLSSEAGLEVYDLRNVRAGGNAPILVARTAGLHYRRLAVSGNRLAGVYPSTDLPCYPKGTPLCSNSIDIFDISTPTVAPTLVGSISSTIRPFAGVSPLGFNDVAFNSGLLIAISEAGLYAFDITNSAAPHAIERLAIPGKWLVSNGADFIAIGNDETIDTVSVRVGFAPLFLRTRQLTIPSYLGLNRANPLRFNRNAWFDDTNARLVTLVDEVDQMTQHAARTIAFDVFDFTVPQLEGSVERLYEEVTMTSDDEVKHNPVTVGPYVYVIGETTGLQSWGSCGVVTGRIELDSIEHLTCGGAQIHGWVTGTQKITNVELFLDNASLGPTLIGGPPRTDISSTTPVDNWRIGVNLDNTPRGEHVLRAIGTDILNNRRQFASQRIFFPGAPSNCIVPRRRAVR
jgi:hypothetical protein